MMIGRLGELGQEPLRPQREETRGPALQFIFFPSLGSPAGWSCPLAELSGEPENTWSTPAASVQRGRAKGEMSGASLTLVPSSPTLPPHPES